MIWLVFEVKKLSLSLRRFSFSINALCFVQYVKKEGKRKVAPKTSGN